jgi:hypothetical protein
MPRSKLQREFQADEEGTVVVPREVLPPVPEVSITAVKKTVKREMSEAQKANMERMIEANKERWARIREEKARAMEDEKQKRKAEEEKLIEAGTHVRVKLKEKREVHRKQVVQEEERPVEPEPVVVKKVVKPKQTRRVVYEETETETPTETEDDTDFEEERKGKRSVRREVKKNLKAMEKIDNVLRQVPSGNPYVNLLASRWK